jgi:hypothetical protein
VVLTHRYAEAWTIPHHTPSRSRSTNEANARAGGSTALTNAIEAILAALERRRDEGRGRK